MHDSLSKTIDALALGAAALPHMLGEPDRATRLAHTLRDGSLVAARDARALIEELRTPAAFQLAEDLPWICREWTAAYGVPVEVKVSGVDLAPPVAAELVWILREALRNTARHARARHVRVTLAGHGDRATLTVEDDGVGFAVVPEPAQLLHAGHHGLVGMAERARVCGGSLVVNASPLGGTRIAASVPRNVATASTALPMRWRIGVTAAVAASCGALVVALSSTTPHTPPSIAAPLPAQSPTSSPVAGPTPSAVASPTPSPSLACRVKYAKQSEWNAGFVADITITNTGGVPIDGWQMTFAYTAGQKIATAGTRLSARTEPRSPLRRPAATRGSHRAVADVRIAGYVEQAQSGSGGVHAQRRTVCDALLTEPGHHRLGPRAYAQLLVDAADRVADRLLGQAQLAGDVAVGPAGRQ